MLSQIGIQRGWAQHAHERYTLRQPAQREHDSETGWEIQPQAANGICNFRSHSLPQLHGCQRYFPQPSADSPISILGHRGKALGQ